MDYAQMKAMEGKDSQHKKAIELLSEIVIVVTMPQTCLLQISIKTITRKGLPWGISLAW